MISSSTYQSVFNASPVAEYLLSAEAEILAVNDAFLKIAARTREDLIGHNLFDVFAENPADPEDTGVAALRKSLARVIASGRPDTLALQRFPIWVTLPDGSRRYQERFWSAVNTPILDETGNLVCIAHSTMDVTDLVVHASGNDRPGAGADGTTSPRSQDQARLEAGLVTRAQTLQEVNKALEAERHRLRHLFEHAPGFVYFTHGPDHVINQANNAFFRLVGEREVVGLPVREAFPETAEQGFHELHDEVFRSGKAYIAKDQRVVLQLRTGQSFERYIDLVFEPILDVDGTVMGICGQGYDITDKRRVSNELRAERDQSQYIVDSMNEGFALLDNDWKLVRVNAEAAHILGVEKTLLIGSTLWEIFPESDGTELERFYREVRASGTAGSVDFPFSVGAAGQIWLELRAYPALDGALALFFRDITERKQTDRELRTANRRKDEFLAMLAHELRNPLAPISAAAELLKSGRLDDASVHRTSQLIGRQVRHMTGLVDDLLDVSRVTRGLVTIEKSPQDLKSIVANAIEQVQPMMEAQGHHFVVDLPPQAAHVVGDQKRLIQILANLLQNAAKYTPAGGRIGLQMEVQAEHVFVYVKDNGIGIAPDLQACMFELFTQAERRSDRSQGGLGLGLALVKSLVEHHGGSVECHSAGLGKGSCFSVCLPCMRQDQLVEQAGAADRLPDSSPNRLKIMIVDDNVDAAEALAMLLETSGHQVAIEHLAEPAIARAQREVFDACLLDIGLPDIDGNELARHLRAQPATANALLIAVTGYCQAEDRETTLQAGFDHHLVKPVDFGYLNSILAGTGDFQRGT